MMANIYENIVESFNFDIVPYQFEHIARDRVIDCEPEDSGNEATN
jgi:hypothetical protein